MCVVIQVTVIYLLHGESISSVNKNYNFQFNIIKKLSLIGTLIFYYFHTYLVCVRVYVHEPQCTCGSQEDNL